MASAVAGAGKTTLLVSIATRLDVTNGLYLAYNKSVATEAQSKFPKSIKCCTTHSLAYRPTVIEHKMSLGFFSYRDVKEKLCYEDKCELVESIREFCLSSYTSYEEFIEEGSVYSLKYIPLGQEYLSKMQSGEIPCTHDFYLKYFHILLVTGNLEYDEFDFIALDEAGDLNAVTLAIFNALPAKKKIMVGDPYQNIYSFNHTINCFDVMKGKGALLPMSQSFRVAADIAQRIESFCNNFMDKNMKFSGVELEDKSIKTRAFISRTNGALIGKMIELNYLGVQYGLTRTAKQIFQLPLILCNLKYQGFISNAEYKFIQDDVDNYYEDTELRTRFKTPLSYIKKLYENDVGLQVVITLILKYGKSEILKCYTEASKHEKRNQDYMLGTAHSTKGLEFDEVTLAQDLNMAVAPVVTSVVAGRELDTLSSGEVTELNLYYVACSRAKKVLNGAALLDVKPQTHVVVQRHEDAEPQLMEE